MSLFTRAYLHNDDKSMTILPKVLLADIYSDDPDYVESGNAPVVPFTARWNVINNSFDNLSSSVNTLIADVNELKTRVTPLSSATSAGLMSATQFNKLESLHNYELPQASTSELGGIKIENSNPTLLIDNGGVLSVNPDSNLFKISSLKDVDLNQLKENQILIYNGQEWINSDLESITEFDELEGLQIENPVYGQVLMFNGENWNNATLNVTTPSLNRLTDVIISNLQDGQFLKYSASANKWINSTIDNSESSASNNRDGYLINSQNYLPSDYYYHQSGISGEPNITVNSETGEIEVSGTMSVEQCELIIDNTTYSTLNLSNGKYVLVNKGDSSDLFNFKVIFEYKENNQQTVNIESNILSLNDNQNITNLKCHLYLVKNTDMVINIPLTHIKPELLKITNSSYCTIGQGLILESYDSIGNLKLAPATANNVGGIKPGNYLSVENDGTLNVTLPEPTTASDVSFGVVKVDGTTITANNGVISATQQTPFQLEPATTSDLGGVIPDGTTITIDQNGVISAVNSSGSGEESISYSGSYIVNNDNLLLPSSNRNYNVTIDITDSSSTSSEPAWSYNTTTGEITINGELKKDQYTEQELCHFNGDDNFYNNYVKNKKFILFGIPQIDNEYLDIEIYIRHYDDSDTKYCEINKNTSSTIVEFEEYDNWYQLFIRLTNTNTNSYISFDNFKFTPKLIELEDVIQIGSGLSIDNNILSTTFEGVESIAPLSQITYNPTIGDSETRLVLSNFQYEFFELESENALSKGISKWYTIDGSVLNIKTSSNIHIDCSATGSDGTFVTGKLYIYNSVNDTWSLTETLKLNYAGQSRVDSHPENYFTTPITSNNLYKLYVSIVRKPASESNLFTNIYVKVYMDIEEGSYISKNGYFGNTTGTHLGNANLTGLTLEGTNNKILEFNQGKCNFEINDEESDYHGTYFGITGANFRKYITTVDANDVETTGSYEISINVNDGDIRRKAQADITDNSTIVTKTVQWTASDERIKNSIMSLDSQLSINLIDKTLPKSFKYNDSDLVHYGMIAQETRELLNELGETDSGLEYSIGDTNIPDQRNINYSEYIPHLINYVKDLRNEINELKQKIKEV